MQQYSDLGFMRAYELSLFATIKQFERGLNFLIQASRERGVHCKVRNQWLKFIHNHEIKISIVLSTMDPAIDQIKCPWKLGDKIEESPHIHHEFRPETKKIYDDLLDAIGNTQMIRINKLGKENGVECELLAKCEFMNMGGSMKDRIARRMVLDAEKRGILKPDSRIVEATSGNTGVGVALVSAARGYPITLCMPEKMSAEKANVMKGSGATVIRTPNEENHDSPFSHIGIAKQMEKEGKAVFLDQYCNASNPIAHYDQLAEEILYQCDAKIDAIVVGVGTGGTLTGIARKIREKSPDTVLVGVDPFCSVMAMPQTLNVGDHPLNKVEGIGHNYIPRTCERKHVDHWVKTDDPESFKTARDLISKEGLLVGGSSGSVMFAAMQFAKEKGWEKDSTKRIVCVFSDSIRNYLTRFLSTQWCVENRFLPYDTLNEEGHIFNGIQSTDEEFPDIEAYEDLTVNEAKLIFEKGAKIIPLKKKTGDIYAAIFPRKFVELMNLKKLKGDDSALKTKLNDFVIVPPTLTMTQLEKLLQRNDAVLIETRNEGKERTRLQVATIYNVLKFVK